MTEFQKIIQLRNEGKTQEEIASIVGISKRSVIRYLKLGKIPKYSRKTKSNRPDPMKEFYDLAEEKVRTNSTINVMELFEYLKEHGYKGSARSVQRKTKDIRRKYKKKEVFFQREVKPGDVMEGDFTEIWLPIGKTQRKVYLWVTTLPYSNAYYATAYYNCTFECFAHGSVKAFEAFGGMAQKYRLDNMSPVVKKILSGKERLVTQRYKEFQDHYGFYQDFCNPSKGNEKGNVESNIRHIKKKITSKIHLHNLQFSTIEALREYIWSLCDEHNNNAKISNALKEESLKSLPQKKFEHFRSTVIKINKYSLFSFDKTGNMYSAPSQFIGLTLEARIYFDRVEVFYQTNPVASHKRVYGRSGVASIQFEHIIDGLLKKPGALQDWKYKAILFERPTWKKMYDQMKQQGKTDKDYLSCLRLMKSHGKDLVTLAMEYALEGESELSAHAIENLISKEIESIHNLKPLNVNLEQFDELLQGGSDGR